MANCCCTRDCCTRKILKDTETEETIGFVSSFLSLVALQLEGGAGSVAPPGYAYGFVLTGQVCFHTNHKICHNQAAKEHLR